MIKGIGVSEGIGIGAAYIVKNQELSYVPHQVTDIPQELERFRSSVQVFCEETEKLAENMEGNVDPKETEIIRGHIVMMKDPYMQQQIEDQIKAGSCAEAACEATLDMFAQLFSQTGDEMTGQRASDVRDIKQRMLQILTGADYTSLQDIPDGSILVTEDLTPSMTAELKREHVRGIITEKGGKTSHSAILARALEIPAVLSVPHALQLIREGEPLILDGQEGLVLTDPDPQVKQQYEKRKKDFEEKKQKLRGYIGKETLTADGEKKKIYCNIGNPADAVTAVKMDGEGIGLFRTEFLFMDKNSAPGEEEQFQAYKKVAQLFKDRTVIIRTLDVGGDKGIPYLGMEKEENPFLGFRAVRYCLKNQEIYETQLRALIKASAYGNIKIMVPLVTSVTEIRAVKEKINEIKEEFRRKEIPHNRDLQVGVMMETPAASLIADLLAKECDFFSIGTNDLVQYTMAADRGNLQVAYLNRACDPAVLRSVRHIIKCAKDAGIPVGMCGEAAADPLLTPLLLSFGLEEFSVSPTSVLAARDNIAGWSKEAADAVAEKVMSMETAEDVEGYLKGGIYND